jgi:hypothetical protein
MAKKVRAIEGQELAPAEPWRPEYAPQAITSTRHPASTIVAFVLAAGFGLSIGGAFASQAGILPPLGDTVKAVVADQSPSASNDPAVDPTVDPGVVVDVTPAPTDVPGANPAPTTDPVVIPPPAGGGTGDEDDGGDDDGEGEDDGGEND